MAVKETPTNFRVYYKEMRKHITQKRKDSLTVIDKNEKQLLDLHKFIKEHEQDYKDKYEITLSDYPEFVKNEYKDGTFYRIARSLFTNKKENYKLISDLFDIYRLVNLQKEIYDTKQKIKLYDKLLDLSLKEYNSILKTYYTEVHKQMIINGYGYSFGNNIGWICINRCHLVKPKLKIDFSATKKYKEELIKQGHRVYNSEEANWCKANDITYKAKDYRVYKNAEYCYEIPLLGCTLPNGHKLKLTTTDYRHSSIRGKSNQDLMIECNGDIEKICELDVDIRTKLNIAVEANKILYTKFIRNEDQKPSTTPKADR